MSMPDHDVAIVGGGPVGLLLGCLLSQSGIDVGVYEQRTGSDDRSRAIGIHPPGRRALDAVGVGSVVRDEALALDGGEVLCRGRILASLSFTERQRVLLLPQHRTGALLRERLSELHEGALHLGYRVRGVRDDGDRVQLSLDVDGAQTAVTASYLVAADGVRSGIRELLGVDWRPQGGSAAYVMMDVPDPTTATRVRLHCEPAGLVESFPLPQGMRRWVMLDPHGRFHGAAEFRREIEARTGALLDLPETNPTAFRAQQHRAARTVAGRVILVGDAAHETSPIGGQGMNLGWVAARRLADSIELSLRQGRPAFREYERRTARTAAKAQRRSSFYMTMGYPTQGVRLHARDALIRTLGSAPLRGNMAGMITMRGL